MLTEPELDLVEYYVDKRSRGMEISSIRKELVSKDMSTEKISEIIRLIDSIHLDQIKSASERSTDLERNILGVVLIAIGAVVLWIGVYSNYQQGFKIFVWGPIVFGIFIMRSTWKRILNQLK